MEHRALPVVRRPGLGGERGRGGADRAARELCQLRSQPHGGTTRVRPVRAVAPSADGRLQQERHGLGPGCVRQPGGVLRAIVRRRSQRPRRFGLQAPGS